MFSFLDPIKQYSRLIIGTLVVTLVAGAIFYGYAQQLTIARLETTVTDQQGTIQARNTEIIRLHGELDAAIAVNVANLIELDTIRKSHADTLGRIRDMNRDLGVAKSRIDDLKGLIASYDKAEHDGPVAPVLGATLARINQLEAPVSEGDK